MQRIALYSQDAHGLGRLRRNVAIARALSGGDARSVLLISSAGEPALLKLPPGTDTLSLPAVDAGNAYGSRGLGIDRDGLIRMRSETLRRALAAYAPDVLIVDRVPDGVDGELAASFEVLHELGTQLVLALPEVLGERAEVQAEWRRAGAFDVVRAHYDRVWVYGDPLVFDPADEYEMPADVRAMVRYSGYLDGYAAVPGAAAREAALRAELELGDDAVCVCLAGGSDDGFALAEAFARAPLPEGTTGVILTGPFTAPEHVAVLEELAGARDDLRVVELLAEADTLVWMADQVVAMGGYHTTCEALASARRALLVPSAGRGDHVVRARRLRDIGAVDMLDPGEATPAALGAWIAAGPRPPAALAGAIDTAGLARLEVLVDELRVPVAAPSRRRAAGARSRRKRIGAPQVAAGIAG